MTSIDEPAASDVGLPPAQPSSSPLEAEKQDSGDANSIPPASELIVDTEEPHTKLVIQLNFSLFLVVVLCAHRLSRKEHKRFRTSVLAASLFSSFISFLYMKLFLFFFF